MFAMMYKVVDPHTCWMEVDHMVDGEEVDVDHNLDSN